MQFKENLFESYERNIHQAKHLYEFKNDLFFLMSAISFQAIDGNDLCIERNMASTLQHLYDFIDDLEDKPTKLSPLT